MSEYDDYDRRDDDGRRPDDFADRPVGGGEAVEAARRKALAPGLLLMVIGGLAFGIGLWNVVQKDSFEPQLDAEVAKQEATIDADPNLDAAGKQQSKDMVRNVVNGIKQVYLPVTYAMLVAGFLGLAGGLSLIRLAAYPVVLLAAVLFVIPLTTPCCIGIPFGVWALVAVNGRAVREGYRLKGLTR